MTTVSSRGDLSLLGGTQGGSGQSARSQGSTPRSGSRKSLMSFDDGDALPHIKSSEMIVDKSRPLPTSLQSDFIPEDVLFALTQPPSLPRDKLGPPTRQRNLNVSTGLPRKAADNVWNFPGQRKKLEHLTKNTPCVCGAGKDISFLYDVPKKEDKPIKPNARDPSQMRITEEVPEKKALTLPDTLIPEEYHVVKNKGVMGLEYHEDNFATQPQDHEKHLVKFPSLNPTSRYEVIQLKRAMIEMLDKAGVLDEMEEAKGPTQMHNLLELIKREQDIYNVVFHELIRQSSVECHERGTLLAELRERYSGLLNKVPRQIKGLHEEVLAQRALDRRLTEELMRFKSTIGVLTSELSEVKEHDNEVTNQANQAQDDLKAALAESTKNANLLAEYHDLYELQRQRLEKQVVMLADEKEIWSSAAYSLALKVMQEHSLNTAKRLHVSEKAWAKLANHFTILLSDKDTEMLTDLQGYVDRWRDLIDDFNREMNSREDKMREQLNIVRSGIYHWIKDFEKHLLSKDGHLLRQPDKERVNSLFSNIKQWEEILGQENEKFGGDLLLNGQESLGAIQKQMYGWTKCAMKVFNRHQPEDGKPQPDMDEMMRMNELVEKLLGQYNVRLTGENGVATGIIHISNSLETWDNKFSALLHGSNPLPDQEWLRFFQLMDDWLTSIDETMEVIGSSQKEDERTEGRTHEPIMVHDMMRITQKWLSSATNTIDSEDAKLVEQVTTLHTEMVRWMVQMLLRLAPDRKDHSPEAKEAVLLGSTTIGQLQSNAKTLFDRLAAFTRYVITCCSGFVNEEMQRRLDAREENADHEHNELGRLRTECEEWIMTARMMLCELTGEEYVPEPPPSSLTSLSIGDSKSKLAFHDKEKLEMSRDQTQMSELETPGTARTDAESPAGVEETPAAAAVPIGPPEDAPETQGETQEEVQGEEAEGQQEKLEEPAPAPVESAPAHPGTPIPVTSDLSATSLAQNIVEEDAEEEEGEEEGEQLEVIGADRSTRTRPLEDGAVPSLAPTALVTPAPVPTAPKERSDSPNTPDTKKAFEALAAVESLQSQLIETEERAQTAEERAAAAEAELNLLREKLRNLERKLAPSPSGSEEKTKSPSQEKKDAEPSKDSEPKKEKSKSAKSDKSTKSTKSKKSGK